MKMSFSPYRTTTPADSVRASSRNEHLQSYVDLPRSVCLPDTKFYFTEHGVYECRTKPRDIKRAALLSTITLVFLVDFLIIFVPLETAMNTP